MSPIPSVPIALHLKAARIPIQWTVRESMSPEIRDIDGRVIAETTTENVFWPQVQKTKWNDVELTEIEDALDLRAQLFHIFNWNWTEQAVLAFLNRAGAWRIVDDGDETTWTAGTFATVAYGHREAVGIRVVPITLDEMRRETAYWYRLLCALSNPSKLRAAFRQAPKSDSRPHDRFMFGIDTHFFNTLPVSLEWHGKDPYAVIEAITASELLVAAAWTDVVRRAPKSKSARDVATRFTWPRKKKHCRWECGHLDAVKRHKRAKAQYFSEVKHGYKGTFRQWQAKRKRRKSSR